MEKAALLPARSVKVKAILDMMKIQGMVTRLKWFISASLAVTGIIWLSYEHESSTGGGHR